MSSSSVLAMISREAGQDWPSPQGTGGDLSSKRRGDLLKVSSHASWKKSATPVP